MESTVYILGYPQMIRLKTKLLEHDDSKDKLKLPSSRYITSFNVLFNDLTKKRTIVHGCMENHICNKLTIRY